MNQSTIETLIDLTTRASSRASAFALAGARSEAATWHAVAMQAHRTAEAMKKAIACNTPRNLTHV